jgi:hypothetical protein
MERGKRNLELGVLIDNPNLAEAVEHEMRHVEDFVFERVLLPSATRLRGGPGPGAIPLMPG